MHCGPVFCRCSCSGRFTKSRTSSRALPAVSLGCRRGHWLKMWSMSSSPRPHSLHVASSSPKSSCLLFRVSSAPVRAWKRRALALGALLCSRYRASDRFFLIASCHRHVPFAVISVRVVLVHCFSPVAACRSVPALNLPSMAAILLIHPVLIPRYLMCWYIRLAYLSLGRNARRPR